MSQTANLKVLVVPLDWGLGHSTRCIPIIKHLLQLGCTVILAAEGIQKTLLELEFPHVLLIPIAGYKVQYTKSKRWLPIKILGQLPKIRQSINNEHVWLQKTVKEHSIDTVISDNRYGLWHSSVPAIIITHQLHIKSPIKWIERLIRKVNYQHINRFTACWVPDFFGEANLAGMLSHPAVLPSVPVNYLGALSRFEMGKKADILYELLIVISGPEPQRTLLEKTLIDDLRSLNKKVLFVRGLPGSDQKLESFNQVTIVNHLPASELELAFNQSDLVISRAGYTTVMDIVKLQKRAILIPTPGQTEQEYLAAHLQQQHICLSFDQQGFNLRHAVEQAHKFSYRFPLFSMNNYKVVVEEFVASLG